MMEGAMEMNKIAVGQLGRGRLARLSAHGRRRQRGVTLFEVLIVVAILAMVAGGVAVFALPRYKEAQIKTAKSGAQTIRQAVMQWQLTNGDDTCPTVSQLIQDKFLDTGSDNNDPWGQPFEIKCESDDVAVASAGPDKKSGSGDDIRVPSSGRDQGE
jgi:general secretion pathway protein G